MAQLSTPIPHQRDSGGKIRLSQLLLYLVLILLALLFGFPLFWTLSMSLKTPAELFVFPPSLLPDIPQWQNYINLFFLPRIPVARWTLNSFFVVFMTTTGTIITASLVAYSFARFQYRGRDILFMITLATIMLPAQVTLIPQFVLFHKLGWINTHYPLWVPHWFGGTAFGIFLMRQFILSLPRELDEAALIDGASHFRIFWSILLPLCGPALATLGIITLIDSWSDFVNPLIYLNSPEKFTISIGLQFFKNYPDIGGEPTQHLLMAACILAALPTIAIFFLGQRYFVQGIATSGLKG
jgi:ABC-type glycerol-3-phosphate transport system permease component